MAAAKKYRKTVKMLKSENNIGSRHRQRRKLSRRRREAAAK
jgi:hypothetical protein